MTTVLTNDDARLIEMGNTLAGQIRVALDAFEAMEAEAPPADVEMARSEAIMAPSQTTVAQMLALKPSTLMGFFAAEMAARWADGQSMGTVPAEG